MNFATTWNWSTIDQLAANARYFPQLLVLAYRKAHEPLLAFLNDGCPCVFTSQSAIPYELRDYLELVDWSGRAVIEGKRGSIPDELPPILQRLNIDPAAYIKFINRNEKSRFGNFIGPKEAMRKLAKHFGKSFLKGQTAAAQLFSPG